MIDVAHTEDAGMAVVHDEPGLDGARSVILSPDGSCGFVCSDGHLRMAARPLPAELLDRVRGVASCDFVRMDGDRPVATSTVRVRHLAGIPG